MNNELDTGADLLGVDGCKAGWFVARQCGRSGVITTNVVGRFDDLLEWERAHAIVAVDIPIGLAANGARACDTLARKLLGRPRGSSVFSPPTRAALAASNYREACDINHAASGKRISIQAFHIRDKIAEVDDVLRTRAGAAARVFEVHPELSFMHLRMEQGGPAHGLHESKAHAPGFAIRHALLVQCFGSAVDAALAARNPAQASRDDVLDAFAVLWSARRIASGQACHLPEEIQTDAAGIPMTIYC
jgi:predicted RNase H-like nuclease